MNKCISFLYLKILLNYYIKQHIVQGAVVTSHLSAHVIFVVSSQEVHVLYHEWYSWGQL